MKDEFKEFKEFVMANQHLNDSAVAQKLGVHRRIVSRMMKKAGIRMGYRTRYFLVRKKDKR